jgi:hypothetical protein
MKVEGSSVESYIQRQDDAYCGILERSNSRKVDAIGDYSQVRSKVFFGGRYIKVHVEVLPDSCELCSSTVGDAVVPGVVAIFSVPFVMRDWISHEERNEEDDCK